MIVNEQILLSTLLVSFDLGGTFVFALSGATAGVKHRLDLFGVLVLSFAAGNSGGIARDVMIGAVPPAAISDWRYIAVSIVAGLVTVEVVEALEVIDVDHRNGEIAGQARQRLIERTPVRQPGQRVDERHPV